MQTASRLMAMVAGVLLALASSATARTIYVPSDEPTVQRAVDAALPDDTISVAPGTYFEHIRIRSEDKNGITIEAADPANPPMLQGNTNVSSDGIRIEHAHGVTLRTLSVRDAYNGVRVNNATNTRVVGLRLENNALGVRIYLGRNNSVIDSTILGTRVE